MQDKETSICKACASEFSSTKNFDDHSCSAHLSVLKCAGATYRQWLVGMAMQGMCAMNKGSETWTSDDVAKNAIIQADAVIAKLSEGK